MVACAGRRGCASGRADTQADGAALVARLAALPVEDRPRSVHVSGCDKGCARAQPAQLSLVADAPDGTYDLYVERPDQPGSARFGQRDRGRTRPARRDRRGRDAGSGMTVDAYLRDGPEIYRRSFAIIRAEADLRGVPAALEPAAVRMVHACGMVDLVQDLAWSDGAGTAIRAALRGGATVLTDSTMLADGHHPPSAPRRQHHLVRGGRPGRVAAAARAGTTRSAAAVDAWGDHLDGAVVAIGNAPTALFRLLELLERGGPRPAAIVGIPVGFVGAAESKRRLAEHPSGVPWLTVHGRRGGSALAAAAINALAGDPE